ncbi:MAG TPA: glycosyltransferase, partial [Candidatus Eisenbacteria bacterium]
MRIVHLYKDYFPPVRGGIEQTVSRMARAQAAAGHEVTVLTSAHGGRRDHEERVDGVRIVRCSEWARVASAPLCPGMPAALARLSADVFHLHYPNPTGEVSWLLTRPRGAMVVTYHADIVRQAAAMPVYAPFVRALLARAAVIMPTSEAYIGRSTFLRPHRSKCMVVPHGIEVERFAGLEREGRAAAALRERYGTPLVLFVGRLRYYKGLDVLLDAMPAVSGRLVIVGEGPEAGHLRERTRALGLAERVSFAGDVSDAALLDHLAAADVGVMPSTLPSEAWGMAMVEMLAAGLPVVCTELGTGTTFVNRDGETGLVVPPGDARALAGALNRLLGDPALARRFGAAGKRRATELFSTGAMMRGVEAAYRRALAARGGGAARALRNAARPVRRASAVLQGARRPARRDGHRLRPPR